MEQTARKSLLIANLVIFLLSLILTYIIADIPSISIISRENMTLLTPSNATFRIWILIYTAAIAVNAAFFFLKNPVYAVMIQIFLSILNALWVILWTNNALILSWLINILMFFSLLYVVLSYRASCYRNVWVARYFFMYFGWITVASLIQTVIVFRNMGVSEIFLAVAGLCLIFLGFFYFSRDTFVYPLVIIWALAGIYIQKDNNSPYFLQSLVLLLIFLCSALLLYRAFVKIRSNWHLIK